MSAIAHAPRLDRTTGVRLTSAFSKERALVRLALGPPRFRSSTTNFVNTKPGIAPRPVFLIYAVPGTGEEDIRQPQFYGPPESRSRSGACRARTTRAGSRPSQPSTSDASSSSSTARC